MLHQNIKLFITCLLHDIGKIHPAYYQAKYYGYRDRHATIPFEIYPQLEKILNFNLPHPLTGVKAWEVIKYHHISGRNKSIEIFREADREDFHRHLAFAPAQSRMHPQQLNIIDWLGRGHPVPVEDGEYILRQLLSDLDRTLSSGDTKALIDFVRDGLKPILTRFPSDNRQPLSHITLWDHSIAIYIYLLGRNIQIEYNPIPLYPVWNHAYIIQNLDLWEKLIGGLAHITISWLREHEIGLIKHTQNTRIAWERSRLYQIRRQISTLEENLPVLPLNHQELTDILSETMCSPRPPSPRDVALHITLKYLSTRLKWGLTHQGTLIHMFGSRKLTLAGWLHLHRAHAEIPAHLPPGKYPVKLRTPKQYPSWWNTYTTDIHRGIPYTTNTYLTQEKPQIVYGVISNPLRRVLPKMPEPLLLPNQKPV